METFYTTHKNGQINYEFTPESDDSFKRLVITTPQGLIYIRERQVYWQTKAWSYAKGGTSYLRREYYEAPRMYVDGGEEETILENLQNRTRRPYTIFKKMASELFASIGFDVAKTEMSWRQNAGCKMCPCSPGFVLPKDKKLNFILPDGTEVDFNYFDVWVEVKGMQTVDETKPARLVMA